MHNRFEYMVNDIYIQNSLATRNCITRNSLAAQITFCRKKQYFIAIASLMSVLSTAKNTAPF